jgi:ribonuclease D
MFDYVDLSDSSSLIEDISRHAVIGLDTEFMREKTFFAELCLLQISTPDHIYCADPLVEADLAPFWNVLMARTWVVHSGRQDMEVLFEASGQMPASIFDTQVAAALLGFPPQIGYANLVAKLCNVNLAKSHTRADWTRRPLSASVIEYAAEDVAYLLPMLELLSEKLEHLNRLEWARQDSADLLDKALYQNDPALAINRLKGARNLRGQSRAVAVRLAAWRESEALQRNRPRQWILRDSVLLDIAVARPTSKLELLDIPGLSERTAQRATGEFLQLIDAARQDESEYMPPARPTEQQKSCLKVAQAAVAARAEELNIPAEILAPKKELSAALSGDRQSRVFRGWRKSVVGDELADILSDAL